MEAHSIWSQIFTSFYIYSGRIVCFDRKQPRGPYLVVKTYKKIPKELDIRGEY